MRKRLAVVVTTAALVMSMPVAAPAHECLNANRSDTGSQNSAHGNWFYLSATEVVGFVAEFVGADPAVVGEAFLAEVEAQGLPTSFSIFIGKLTIGANPTTHELVAAYADGQKSADGKGIDHANALFETYVAIMLSVM
jgi:hypothetical protein